MTKKNENKNHMIYVEIILHSYGEKHRDFEIIDINILDDYVATQEIYEECAEKACRMDALCECAVEEVNDYGEVSQYIHRELWKKNLKENNYKILVGLTFTFSRDYWTGESDIDVDFSYEVLEENVDTSKYL